MIEIDTKLGSDLVDAIRLFQKELGENRNAQVGLQHTSTEEFAKIVRCYADGLIEKHVRLSAMTVEEFDVAMRSWLDA